MTGPHRFDWNQVRQFRHHVHRLGRRLPPGGLTIATRSGLQDSAPRAAVCSLHARVEQVRPDSLDTEDLAQVFGPRGAIYVIPRRDVGVFSLGLMPRDLDSRRRLEALARDLLEYLGGSPRRQAEVVAGIDTDNRSMRWAATTGAFLAHWDTVDTWVLPNEDPPTDADPHRLELARRFFHYFGPSTVGALQWWIDGTKDDASSTFEALRPEIVGVEVEGQALVMLACDLELLAAAPPAQGVRLLPPDDAYIGRLTRDVVTAPGERAALWPKAPPPGAIVSDGIPIGTWRRSGRTVTLSPWSQVDGDLRTSIEAEAVSLPLPNDRSPAAIDWFEPHRPLAS